MDTIAEYDEKAAFHAGVRDLLIDISDSGYFSTSASEVPSSPSETHGSLLYQATESLSQASHFAFDLLKEDGHWCGELMSNSTVTSEHALFRQSLGLDLSITGPPIKKWLLSQQNPDGSWGIAPDYPGDISTSTEAYLALKILGMSPSDPEMEQGRKWILSAGGVAIVRIFSRIFLAMFGLFPWDACPQLPAESILAPRQSPINIYKVSSWARSNIVPLLIIRHHEPCYTLPNGTSKDND